MAVRLCFSLRVRVRAPGKSRGILVLFHCVAFAVQIGFQTAEELDWLGDEAIKDLLSVKYKTSKNPKSPKETGSVSGRSVPYGA